MRFPIPVIQLIRVVLVFVPAVIAFGLSPSPWVQAQQPRQAMLRQFDMLTVNSGWVLIDQHLYWTSDAAHTWDEIGPSISPDALIQDVEFIDANQGWMVWTATNSEGSAGFQLAQTIDHGSTWTTRSLSLFQPGEIASHAEKAQMGWFDAQTGWISVKQNSGSNFSVGTLFTTSDAGNSWSRQPLPVADKVYFSNPQTGWAVGGPAGDQVFTSQDGGITWKSNAPTDLQEGGKAMAYPPFVSGRQGLLVMTTVGVENHLKVYSSNAAPDQWSPAGQVSLDVQPGVLGLSILDAQNFVTAIPGTRSIVRMVNGEISTLKNKDGLSASIVELDMASLDVGWAKSVDSGCQPIPSTKPETGSVSCTSTTRLLQTMDGGINWTGIQLPLVQSDNISVDFPGSDAAAPAVDNSLSLANTELFIGQGFDRCEIPTLSQMQTWSEGSPYKTVNLYIGGSSRACENRVLTSSYLFQLYQQGWKFIPTWVGPQAPCTRYPSRMATDVTAAYTQGVEQANLAVDRLAELGLTGPEKTGSVIYYDIEAYGTDFGCRSAVNSFMNGWVSQIRARGSLAGVYGSTLCETGLSDFLGIANVPDVIWPARWYHGLGSGYYDPTASVWNLGGCVPNTAWANHQRIRQYEGDHYETWGGLTLDIDSNVLDGVVAFPYDYPFASSVLRKHFSPTNEPMVDFTVSFSKSVTGVNKADFALTTVGVTGASISAVSGSGTTYVVTVNTGTGDGTIRLDVVDNDSIRDGSNNPLGGNGMGNGNYASGEIYTIVKSSIFADVPSGYWSESFILRLYDAGVTSGCSTSPMLYCPTTTVTRDQMAVFLLRAKYGANYSPPAATGVFEDVPTNHWAAAWIEQLAAEGITGGCSVSPRLYCPATPVTRDQMAVFLLRAKHGSTYGPPTATGVFQDVPTDSWAAAWIERLAAEGITGGCSAAPSLYCPATPVSRDQMAVFLVRTFNLP